MRGDELLPELFDRAMALKSEDREAFLQAETSGNAELQNELRALISTDDATGEDVSWDRSALENEARLMANQGPPPLEQLGPYRILDLIGRGGMGEVYRAERMDAEYIQIVAIKRTARAFADSQSGARFRNERQILADLEHPNIARLLDGGTDPEGRPYLVMEFVAGEALTPFCENRKLTLAERLKLFRDICSAVHHAHQHMVIHRDLKPANILVTADGTVKLLDFGIAKLVVEAPEDGAANTLTSLMTPGYASPEQVRGEPATAASDIYSLGVILYELLTGESPYGKAKKSPHELMNAVCGDDPARPSTTVPPSGVLAGPWRRRLRGDLDNIVLKALKKNPRERYASADQLSDDVRRHLEGLPVLARGDAFSYLAGRFLRRHKVAATAAALVLATLVGGIITTARAERRAERRFNQVRKLSHAVVFDYHDSIESLPGSTPVRQRLVKDALEYLDSLSGEADNPSLQRELVDAYVRISRDQGNSYYLNLGDTTGALASARKAVRLGEALIRKDPTPATKGSLAAAYAAEADILYSQDQLNEAKGRYSSAVALGEEVVRLQPDDADSLVELGVNLRKSGDLRGGYGLANLGSTNDAVQFYERAVSVADKLARLRPGERTVKKARYQVVLALATTEMTLGHAAKAETGLREALSLIEEVSAMGPANTLDRAEVANVCVRIGVQLYNQRHPLEAVVFIQKAARILEDLTAADPENTFYTRSLSVTETHLANALRQAGQPEKAAPHNRRALALIAALCASDPKSAELKMDLALNHRKFAETLLALNDVQGALDQTAAGMAILSAMQGSSENALLSANLARTLRVRGNAQTKGNDLKSAMNSYRESESKLIKLAASDPANAAFTSDLAWTLAAAGDCLSRMKKPEEAATAYLKAIQSFNILGARNALTPVDAFRAEETGRKRVH